MIEEALDPDNVSPHDAHGSPIVPRRLFSPSSLEGDARDRCVACSRIIFSLKGKRYQACHPSIHYERESDV